MYSLFENLGFARLPRFVLLDFPVFVRGALRMLFLWRHWLDCSLLVPPYRVKKNEFCVKTATPLRA